MTGVNELFEKLLKNEETAKAIISMSERHLTNSRSYYAKDKESCKERSLRWSKANPNKAKAAREKWRRDNKDWINFRQRIKYKIKKGKF